MFQRQKRKPTKVICLIDFENLIISAKRSIDPTQFSIEAGFRKIIGDITSQIGEITGIFCFLPPDRAMIWGEELHGLKFNIIVCPRIKIKGEQGTEQDTTDSRMIELGEWLINNTKGLTHLCIGSGDSDFSGLIKIAKEKGLKIATIAADIRSLSSEVIKLADENPLTKKKLIFLFSPAE